MENLQQQTHKAVRWEIMNHVVKLQLRCLIHATIHQFFCQREGNRLANRWLCKWAKCLKHSMVIFVHFVQEEQ